MAKSKSDNLGTLVLVGAGLYVVTKVLPGLLPGPKPSPRPDPLPTSPVGFVKLGGRIASVQLAANTVTKAPGEAIRATVKWAGRTTRNNVGVSWNYLLYIGIGLPESLLPGRQFKSPSTQGLAAVADYGVEQTTVIDLAAPFDPGKYDVMVSLTALPGDSGGEDVANVWPFDSFYREVAAMLRQDGVTVVQAADVTMAGGEVLSVDLAQRRGLMHRRYWHG